MARKKIDLTGALEDILNREQEAQRLFEESGRREQLFRSEEEIAYDESLLETESEETITEEPKEFEKPDLPEPEVLDFIEQSTKGVRETHRPDLYPEYYGAAKAMQSTVIQAMQWVPTGMEEVAMTELADPLSKGLPEKTDITLLSVVGDLLVAFARPSRSQTTTGTLYVFSGISREMWNAIRRSGSFGRSVKSAGVGRLYSEKDRTRYTELHPEEEYWLFNLSWTSPRDVATPPPPKVKKSSVKGTKLGKKDVFK